MIRIIHLWIAFVAILVVFDGKSQGISINSDNSAPAPSAILDVKSTSQGILFPRMTEVQRNAIPDPAHGLHIFNTNIGTVEYYDSIFSQWTAYCESCKYFIDTLSSLNDSLVSRYILPPEVTNYKKIILVIGSNIYLTDTSGGGFNPIDLTGVSAGSNILIKNYGKIVGYGGNGGHGGSTSDNNCPALPATQGANGGTAINSKTGTTLTIHNYGILAGGGGGGGGGGAGYFPPDCGGGGGGGAGIGDKGGRGNYFYQNIYFVCFGDYTISLAQDGQNGSAMAGGTGGNGGQSGSPLNAGYAGGNGGGPGQPGQNGIDSYYYPGGPGGLPGKAVSGNAGNNTVINLGGGAVYGVVD